MMLIHYDEDMYETTHESHTCPYHKMNPGKSYAGCTCSFSVGSRLRPYDEYLALRAKREREREDAVLAEAEAIKARRGIATPLNKAETE